MSAPSVVHLSWIGGLGEPSKFLGVVVIQKTGVIYMNQAGGLACRHPEQEGYLVPLDHDVRGPVAEDAGPVADLDRLFAHWFSDWGGFGEITHVHAEILDQSFERWGLPIRVDRSRLAESQEAWLFVHITTNPGGPLERVPDLGPVPGILAWENSD